VANNIEAAIGDLTAKLQQQMNDVSETKKAINVLTKMVGKEPMFPDEAAEQVGASFNIEPDQYYGRPLATCVQEYLEARKKATGKKAIQVEDILAALEQGGFDFKAAGWRDSDRLRPLSISLAKNNKVFHRLPNGWFGLLSWYPDVVAKKEPKEKQTTAAAQDASQADEADKEPEGGKANAA
jgi:hypothetical protein